MAAAATAPTRELLELDNRTTVHASVRSLIENDPRIFSYCGVDLVGGDAWVERYSRPDDCVTHCLAETGCNAATWTNSGGGTCYFKRLQGKTLNAVARFRSCAQATAHPV